MYMGSLTSKIWQNFEVFCWNILLSINLSFLQSVVYVPPPNSDAAIRRAWMHMALIMHHLQ